MLSSSSCPLGCDNMRHFFVWIFACAGLLDIQTDIQDHLGQHCAGGRKIGFDSGGSGSNSALTPVGALPQPVWPSNTGRQYDAPGRLDTNPGRTEKKVVFEL
jgi:hypothetical protein